AAARTANHNRLVIAKTPPLVSADCPAQCGTGPNRRRARFERPANWSVRRPPPAPTPHPPDIAGSSGPNSVSPDRPPPAAELAANAPSTLRDRTHPARTAAGAA